MKIKDIIVNCNLSELIGDKDIDINKVSFDSRTVEPGTMFWRKHKYKTSFRACHQVVLDFPGFVS